MGGLSDTRARIRAGECPKMPALGRLMSVQRVQTRKCFDTRSLRQIRPRRAGPAAGEPRGVGSPEDAGDPSAGIT